MHKHAITQPQIVVEEKLAPSKKNKSQLPSP